MSGALFYPPADRAAQWFGGEFQGTVMGMTRPKVVLHTTETAGGWPWYSGGSEGPTLTYEPWQRRWRQHFRLNQSARALRDPSGTPVRENRADCVQIEISAYCDPAKRGTGKHIDNLDADSYDDLGRFVAFMHVEWDLPLTAAPKWLAYPASYGDTSIRMSSAEYESFAGVLGHQHVSGNTHGDPGDLDVTRILDRANAHLTRGSRIDRMIALGVAAKHATDNPARRRHLAAAVDELRAIPVRLT